MNYKFLGEKAYHMVQDPYNPNATIASFRIAYSADESYLVQVWFENGVPHRGRGPAVIWDCGRIEFWYNGKVNSPYDFLPAIIDLASAISDGGTCPETTIEWAKDGVAVKMGHGEDWDWSPDQSNIPVYSPK